MPYVAIKAFPKDEASTKRVVERFYQVLQEEWGSIPQSITISFEEFDRSEWVEEVVNKQILPNAHLLMIRGGEKLYQ